MKCKSLALESCRVYIIHEFIEKKFHVMLVLFDFFVFIFASKLS